jgi:hypothetical protein
VILYTVGCSFTYAQQRGWPNILADKINFTLENKGHPGFDTHERWADLILKKLNEDNYITTEKK